MNDLTAKPAGDLRTMEQPNPAVALVALLTNTTQLKEVPVETVERLWAVHKEFEERAAAKEFNIAFNKMQSQMTPVHKAARNAQTNSMYALIDDIQSMLDPLLTSNGFSHSISTEDSSHADHIRFVLWLRHVGGHVEKHQLDAPIDNLGMKGTPNKTRLQGMGSSYSYAKRYLLCNVCGVIVGDDTDGNLAGHGGANPEFISLDEQLNLQSYLESTNSDISKFKQYFKIDNIAQLPKSKLKTALDMCAKKERQQKMGGL